jgi:hypothetical protein
MQALQLAATLLSICSALHGALHLERGVLLVCISIGCTAMVQHVIEQRVGFGMAIPAELWLAGLQQCSRCNNFCSRMACSSCVSTAAVVIAVYVLQPLTQELYWIGWKYRCSCVRSSDWAYYSCLQQLERTVTTSVMPICN